MRLFLVRHAHSDPGDPDELRPLSARGREQARELAERLAEIQPTLIVTSPLLRARETAGAVGTTTGAEVKVDERLSPGAGAEELLAALEGAEGVVVAVGHQPDCSEIAAALGAGDLDFPPGGVVEIDVP